MLLPWAATDAWPTANVILKKDVKKLNSLSHMPPAHPAASHANHLVSASLERIVAWRRARAGRPPPPSSQRPATASVNALAPMSRGLHHSSASKILAASWAQDRELGAQLNGPADAPPDWS